MTSDPTPTPDLDALERLRDDANIVGTVHARDGAVIDSAHRLIIFDSTHRDAAYIAQLVNDAPALLASAREREALEEQLESAKARLAEVIEERDHQYAYNAALIATEADLKARLTAAEQRAETLRAALEAARQYVHLDDSEHDYNPFAEDGDTLDEHDPDSCSACMRNEALAAIDAALAQTQEPT